MSLSHTLSSGMITFLTAGLLAGSVRPTAAQPAASRGFITINAGFQPSKSTFPDNAVFTESGGVYGDMVSGAATP